MPKIAIERDLGANFPMTPVGGGGVKGRLAISRRGSIYHGRGENLCIMNYWGGCTVQYKYHSRGASIKSTKTINELISYKFKKQSI